MTIVVENIKAICLDFGNTLVELGPKQVDFQNAALKKALDEGFDDCNSDLLKAIRYRQMIAPFSNGFRENDMRTTCLELIEEIYDLHPSDSQVDMLMQTRFDAFVHVVELSTDVRSLLKKLGERYRLGFLSNYPCSRSVRAALEKIGLSEMFESITISGDVGYAKPHAKPFEVMLSQLGLSPAECVYIGDNWFCDVQGSKRIGMNSILTTQYEPYETNVPAKGDYSPDLRINHIKELESFFLC